ncbi:MAG: hypothetical protein GY817_03660 [bacterium]|nr:hypothetical protein [bacterium]
MPRMRAILLDSLQNDWAIFLVFLFLLLPIALVVVYIFHLLFEKPFVDHNINTIIAYKNYLRGLPKIIFDRERYKLFLYKVTRK